LARRCLQDHQGFHGGAGVIPAVLVAAVLNMPGGWSWPPNAAMKAEGEACLHHLDALGVKWRRAPGRRKVATPIYLDEMSLGGVALTPTFKKGPFVMDCLLAAALADSADLLRSLGVEELRFAEIYD